MYAGRQTSFWLLVLLIVILLVIAAFEWQQRTQQTEEGWVPVNEALQKQILHPQNDAPSSETSSNDASSEKTPPSHTTAGENSTQEHSIHDDSTAKPSQDAVSPSETSSDGPPKININTATLAELDELPGIGPAKAQAIIDYRNMNGPFQSIEELLHVKGIGEKTFAQIRERVTVDP